ncbi:tail tube GTA-gp10-like protein [Methylosinus sp. sav-2]|uniref:gene transfer agent family protein n=1 Tax=Methylosinus sp. sav-2 TaxID=2485168 RepID=UPI00068F0F63|nr:gene transfer agent family protein [Methylosinus sp. sav-2]TDX63997.1 tail tube GTA-gp10-like protein [Methylosinus sp. sav-2]
METSETRAATTVHYAVFGGRRRRFCLRIGEIGELEDLCSAGVGAIWRRLALLEFRHADIRETIRLGLIGGGEMQPGAAEALVSRLVDARPLAESVDLAVAIMRALIEGVTEEAKRAPGKETAESAPDAPETSPPISSPAQS